MTYEVLEREYIITKSATRAGLPPLPEDPKEALAWMRSGVKTDDSRATFELAQAYQYGKCGISINAMTSVGTSVSVLGGRRRRLLGAAASIAVARDVFRPSGRARRLPRSRARAARRRRGKTHEPPRR